jgi:lipopolysaccharide/colanic/teichoic acid biosynthesis glycosyltransferase
MSIRLPLKRVIDVALCLVVLVVTAPLLLVIAIAIKLTSRGPALLIQERVGRNKRIFGMYKFRTMRADHKPSDKWNGADESAVTSIGGVLRDYGLDELPQLFNILKGEMSIVGPRPPLASQIARYEGRFVEIFAMPPGVLSLAAAEGRRAVSPEERMELHLRYVQRWSLRLDVYILWKCLFVVLRRQNVKEAPSARASTTETTT